MDITADNKERIGPAEEIQTEPAETEQGKAEAVSSKAREAARTRREAAIAESQKELTNISALRSIVMSGKIMRGTVAAAEELVFEDKAEIAVSVFIRGSFKVVIPFPELFASLTGIIDMRTVDTETEDGRRQYLRRKKSIAEKLVGAEISFILTNLFETGTEQGTGSVAYGSRARALAAEAGRSFGGASPVYLPGADAKGTVIAVSRHAVVVNCGGVDIVIPQYRLTRHYMTDVIQGGYKTGDTVRGTVRTVSGNGSVWHVELDPITAEQEEERKRLTLLPVGARTHGIVTNVYHRDSRIFIYADLIETGLMARVRYMNANDFGRDITAGCDLRLEVTGYDEKNAYVICSCLSEHGNSGMFRSGYTRQA